LGLAAYCTLAESFHRLKKKIVKGARRDMLGEYVLSIDVDDLAVDRRRFASCSQLPYPRLERQVAVLIVDGCVKYASATTRSSFSRTYDPP
jgi:hypothetical protein